MTTKHKYKVGDKVTFEGYAQLDADQPEILTLGAEYKITALTEDGGYEVRDRDGKGDKVFDDEIAAAGVKKARKAKATTAKASTAKKTTAKGRKAKTEPVEEPATDIDTAIQVLTDSKSVSTILESKDMLTAAKELAVAAEETFLSLGGVLSHIYDTGAHHQLGYIGKRGFADYMLKELNILYRKGMYLIEIYKVARKYNLDERLLAEIGWSKMKEIANKLTQENADELLEYARDHNREDLVVYVRKTFVKAGKATDDPGKVLKTRLTFTLFGDQAEVVERALEAASAQIEKATPEKALMLITAEWSQFTEGVTLSAEQAFAALVERFGAKAIAKCVEQQNNQQPAQQPVELIEAA